MPVDDIQEDIAINEASEGGRNEHRGVDISMVSRWEAFFQGTEYMQRIREVSDLYPEVRSINVVYADLDHFDADLAVYLLEHPDLALLAGKQAMRNLMHAEMRQADINLRIISLPRDSKVEIRQLRAKHVGKLVCVEGLARKATEVRPKITDALFQCLRCGQVIKEVQEGLFFKEPMECYKEQDGCGRTPGTTKFKLLTEESRFVDTQKIEVQESPEGLRGGAQPERLTGYLEDDIAGMVSPGDRVVLNGILRSVQKGQPNKSTLFDISLDVISAEFQQHEYEEINITEEDEEKIREIASSPDLFDKIIASISPTIYGYNTEKESLALQLFSGVPKVLDDGTRIRGDIHILLVGDPGVAKCVTSDSMVTLSDGSLRRIGDIVEDGLAAGSEEIDDGLTAEIDLKVMTFSARGRIEEGRAVRVWKRTAPEKMIRLRTAEGRTLTMTPTHPLFAPWANRIMAREVRSLKPGMSIVVHADAGDDPYGWNKLGFAYDIIESIEEIAPEEEWVYDLEVEDSHNYVANGILSHNSQMLRYMSRLAPRGIYASGKSSSAAGLCVSPDSLIVVNGEETRIGEFVERHMSSPQEVEPSQWMEKLEGQYDVATMSDMCQTLRRATAIWRIKTPSFLVELVETSGKRLTLTPETKVWCRPDASTEGWSKASDVREGQSILVSDGAGGFRWSQVSSKRALEKDLPPFVYDLTVDGSHSFVANGFVVHNTAAAVKDDFGEGRWTLEAGALVLADKGQACIEENQPVVTTRGLVPIKDVRVGDTVLNYSNGPSYGRVKRVIRKGERRTIRLRLYSGEIIECTPDHRILTSAGWTEAGQLTRQDLVRIPADYSTPKLMDRERFEKGFLHGFVLCDLHHDGSSPKNALGLSSGPRNDRAAHIAGLLERHYGVEVGETQRLEVTQTVGGQAVCFDPCVSHQCSSRDLKEEVQALFHQDQVPLDDVDYCIGFLAGVVSTDRCVVHEQGRHGIKNVVDIGVGSEKHGPEWTERKQRLLLALFHRFGIMAVRRGRKVQITSLDSYNRLADLVGPHVVGENGSKLYPVVATKHMGACDTLLDDDYADWFSSVKFNASRTVELGLRSRIYRAMKKRKVTTALMETLRPHWSSITDEPFREPAKNYLLNPVVDIEEGGLRQVYDLTIEGEPNFLVSGGIVHNCVDEMDKMTDQDRSSMHEAMESQCYDDQTEVLTDHGWKFFKDVDEEDLIASLSKNGELKFVKPTQYVEADYSGDFYYITGRQVNLAVSPNHNIYVSVHKRADQWGPFKLQRMDELPEGKKLKFKRNALWKGKDVESFHLPAVLKFGNQVRVGRLTKKEFKMDDWLEFLGYYLSEGSVQRKNGVPYRVHITQTKSQENIEKIGACIARLGYEVRYDGHSYAISDKQLAAYLAPLGKCYEKHIPREFLELSSRQLLILFDALMLGDGHIRERTGHRSYGTSSRKLADDMQELALKIGISANVTVTLPGGHQGTIRERPVIRKMPYYTVSFIDGFRRNMNEPMINCGQRRNITKAPYSGKIYCVEVPDHVIYVRRNGKPVWCGNTISVAKAGITATLQCRCSLLGAANPKYGRFEQNQYIADQINMPPALLSRFDLIFALTDKPSAERDANITAHILKTHRRGQIKKYEDPGVLEGVDVEGIMSDTKTVEPALDREFFRKYVAYAKRINPVLSDDAMKLISDFYLKIRKQGEGEGASVPITARQLEAFVRLSEASARARLSRIATVEDAQRAIRIVEYYLRKIAGEGDRLDFDIIATGTSHSQREQITILKDLIGSLLRSGDGVDPRRGVSGDMLFKAAADRGITEDRAKTLLRRLSQNGEIYSPSSGFYKLTSEG